MVDMFLKAYFELWQKSSFHKIDQKTFKGIIWGLHLTTFVNILPKLRYFEDRNYIQIGYKSYSVLLFSQKTYERWGHLGFLERRRILEKRGGDDLEKGGGGMTPLPTMRYFKTPWFALIFPPFFCISRIREKDWLLLELKFIRNK